jgi:hypothetical protein
VQPLDGLVAPPHNLQSIQEISEEAGFKTTQESIWLIPYDLRAFMHNEVPAVARSLISSVDTPRLERQITEAIEAACKSKAACSDKKRVYEIVPYFKSINVFEA